MNAILMNFGDNLRIVCDTGNNPVSIGIGQIVEADLHELHFQMIERAIGTDTLMVIPKNIELPEKLKDITELMTSINNDEYDELLVRFNAVVPHDGESPFRPTREMMITVLRELARVEVGAALGVQMQPRVPIREEGDETTRQPADQPIDTGEHETERQPPRQAPAPAARRRR